VSSVSVYTAGGGAKGVSRPLSKYIRSLHRWQSRPSPLVSAAYYEGLHVTTNSTHFLYTAATGGAFSGLAAYDTAVYASDSKNAALFTDDDEPSRSNRDSLGTTTAVLTETRRSFFGGLSDVPSSDQQSRIEESDNGTLVPPPRAAVPPPKYSRFG